MFKKEKKQKVHPVFEKLEFYLNLKNDFALTFIRDEHRVYFFFWKQCEIPPSPPKCLKEARRMGNINVVPDVVSLTERETGWLFLSCSSDFLVFVFVNCARGKKKKESLGLFFLFHRFRLFFVGGDINLVNAKLVNTVLNLCTLKCVLLPVQL